MTWKCGGCNAVVSDSFLWCTSCDHCKRTCDDCGTALQWQNERIYCPNCSATFWPN